MNRNLICEKCHVKIEKKTRIFKNKLSKQFESNETSKAIQSKVFRPIKTYLLLFHSKRQTT